MIGPADDYPIHQTHEPVRYVATSDRRFYDRYFFTGHNCEDDFFFMMGLGTYPNLGVVDAFGSIAVDGQQYTIRASREMGGDRMYLEGIGPLGLEVKEGMRKLRIWCEPNDSPLHFDLEWNAAIEAFAEPTTLNRVQNRVVEHYTRLIQTGSWTGTIQIGDRKITLSPDKCLGARDRSWGVRSIGLEREPKGIAQAKDEQKKRTTLWVWTPMQFPSRTIHLNVAEFPNEERNVDSVLEMPNLGSESEQEVHLSGITHDLKFDPETRDLLEGSSVSFLEADGSRRHVKLFPLCRGFLRAGTGYGGPDIWRHGKYMGESWSDHVSFDISDPAVTAKIGPSHVLCRMEADNGEIGYGTFETQVYGAYPRYGFHE